MQVARGCTGSPPTQIATVQPFDNQKDCLALCAEISGNSQPINQFADELADKRVENIAAGNVGLVLFWPALFAMDFQDAGSSR